MAGSLLFTAAGRSGEIPGTSVYQAESVITRLTFSGSNRVGTPSISDDGRDIVFVEEIRDTSCVPGKIYLKRMINCIHADGSEARLLFADSTVTAPAPYEDGFLMVGTKPPALSGNGKKVIFSLSLSHPAGMADRFLGVINSDGTGFRVLEFQNEALAAVDWKREGFTSDAWSRVAAYAISDDGGTIACAVKGHDGPVSKGTPGGILLIDVDRSTFLTVLAPVLAEGKWAWNGFPRNPLTGGGWAFALSGDGRYLLFGAQSSEEQTDYDLYRADLSSGNVDRVTSIRDRLFSYADISDDGRLVTFFYAGRKLDGPGTYRAPADIPDFMPIYVDAPPHEERIDYDDVTGTGEILFFQTPEGAFGLDVKENRLIHLFGPETPGYVRSGIGMDFPAYPSFWAPTFASDDGQTLLLTGIPTGKDVAELYLLKISDMTRARQYCPLCKQKMKPTWRFCPYDGTSLE